ncbi:MAG: hypothetical protein C4523_06690 [Myxococcales bacterium]|nr:MAG: hypothetical protein C4523_06690 [Myxococcales bacterium]
MIDEAAWLNHWAGEKEKFVLHRFPIEALVRHLSSERRWSDLLRHRSLTLALDDLTALACHWRALAFCLDHGVVLAADGARRVAWDRALQNPAIGLRRLEALYAELGVRLEHPAFEEDDSLKRALHALRYYRLKDKRLVEDKPLAPEPERALARAWRRVMRPEKRRETFERRMAAFFGEKIAVVARALQARRKDPAGNPWAKLLEDEAKG